MTGEYRWILLNDHPALLAGLALFVALTLYFGHVSASNKPNLVRLALFVTRMAAMVALCAVILRPALESDLIRLKRPPLAMVVDNSTSMALGEKPLADASSQWLKQNAGKLAELREVYKFEEYSTAIPLATLPKRPEAKADYNAKTTPLGRTLEAVMRQLPDNKGIILLSDGRDTLSPGKPPKLPVPVYPVLFEGADTPDLWIQEVKTPPVAFIRTPVEVRVKLGKTALKAEKAEVSVIEDKAVLSAKIVDFSGSSGEATLFFTPKRTGRKAYRVEVKPLPGETLLENNRAQFSLNVIRDKTRVLLLTGTPSWDTRFLRTRLKQDPGIDLITFMILRTPNDLNLVDNSELSLIPFPTEELFNSELPSFDAVIFDNFDYVPYVPVQYMENVRKFVNVSGGGVIMVGGDRSFGLGGYANSPLADILPVDLSGSVPGSEYRPGPFKPRLTALGQSHPVLTFDPDPAQNARIWESLPEFDGLNWSLRVRPGSVCAVEAPQAKNEYGPAPVIAFGESGQGRTMAVMTDSLWRWKMIHESRGGDPSVYRDFWTRALRWITHDPDMELLRISPPAEVVAGESAVFSARVLDRFYRPASGASIKATAMDEKGNKIPVTFKEAAPGEYLSEPVVPATEGLWGIAGEARQGDAFLGRDDLGFPVGPPSPEPLRVGLDKEYLEALAQNSSGRLVETRGSDKLLDELIATGRDYKEIVGRKVEEPWARSWVLWVIIALVGLDWVLRRQLQ